jgi:hypothetical protein
VTDSGTGMHDCAGDVGYRPRRWAAGARSTGRWAESIECRPPCLDADRHTAIRLAIPSGPGPYVRQVRRNPPSCIGRWGRRRAVVVQKRRRRCASRLRRYQLNDDFRRPSAARRRACRPLRTGRPSARFREHLDATVRRMRAEADQRSVGEHVRRNALATRRRRRQRSARASTSTASGSTIEGRAANLWSTRSPEAKAAKRHRTSPRISSTSEQSLHRPRQFLDVADSALGARTGQRPRGTRLAGWGHWLFRSTR